MYLCVYWGKEAEDGMFVARAGANEESSIVIRRLLLEGNRRQDRLSNIIHNSSNVPDIFPFTNHLHMHSILFVLYNSRMEVMPLFISSFFR